MYTEEKFVTLASVSFLLGPVPHAVLVKLAAVIEPATGLTGAVEAEYLKRR